MTAQVSTTNRRKTAGATLLVGAMVLLGGCGAPQSAGNDPSPADGQSDELATVRVATSVSNSFPFVVVQAGERLGTWEESGLEVEVVEATTPTIGQVMAGGQADIALAGASSIASNTQSGVDMTMVASNLSYWDQRIIALPGTGSVEELEGGNFGISGAGSPGHYSVVKMAEELGWADDEYTVTSLGNLQSLTAGLTSGSIDAFAWSSQAAFQLEESGGGEVIAPAADFVGPNVLQAFAVMNPFAEENPEAVQTFFEEYFEMVEEIQANPQLFIDVLVEEWEVDPVVAERVAEDAMQKLSVDGVIEPEELEGIRDSVAFTLEVPIEEVEEIKYTYWKDLK